MQTKSGMYLPMACRLLKLTPNWSLRMRDHSLRSAGVGSLRRPPAWRMILGVLLRGRGISAPPYPPQIRRRARRIWGGKVTLIRMRISMFMNTTHSPPPQRTAISPPCGAPATISSPCGTPAALAEGFALARSYRDTPRCAAVR